MAKSISGAIKRVILFQGVKTSFTESTSSMSATSTITQTKKHRFSRCIEKIVVLRFVTVVPKLPIEALYARNLDIAVDKAISDGSLHKLFFRYKGVGHV